MLRLPPCLACQCSGHECRRLLILPGQKLHVRLYAVVWPTPRPDATDDDMVWYDPKDAVVV